MFRTTLVGALVPDAGWSSPFPAGLRVRWLATYNLAMPRDPGLEELIESELGNPPGLTGKAMFGGWGFLLYGNLLAGVRKGSVMLRIGADNEAWALEIEGVTPVVMRVRHMKGYVRASWEAYANDAARQRLLEAAVAFTRTLPKK